MLILGRFRNEKIVVKHVPSGATFELWWSEVRNTNGEPKVRIALEAGQEFEFMREELVNGEHGDE